MTNPAATAPLQPPSRPELEHMNLSSYSATPTSQASPMISATAVGYDAEAAQMKATAKGHGLGNVLKKQRSSIEKQETEDIEEKHVVGKGNGGRPASTHQPYSYSISLGTPPDNSNVVLNEELRKTKVGQVYAYLLTVSIVSRWILFIVPVLAILWIPGILSLTKFPDAKVWGVRLLWWSIWLTVAWGGWWAALAASRIIPVVIRSTIGIVAVSTRKYIDWIQALHRYTAVFAWTLAIWVSYLPLIQSRQDHSSNQALSIIGKLLLGCVICSGILLFEKFSIQWIAGKFHEKSYAERIADQKAAVRTLVTLYKNSVHLPGRMDTLGSEQQKASYFNKRILRKLKQGVRVATTTTATVFGNVASEIAGSSVLQPNSPPAIIKTALESANKSRLLARRIFYSFTKPGAEYMVLGDVERFFPTHDDAVIAFSLFDRDGNGDISREELEVSCLEFHREQLSIENSMRDLDSAVGRLDNIFMSLYVVIAAIIFAVILDAQMTTLITGAGTLVLGLSWLIGGSLQEVLTSIIFLFIKHPFDVGDRVVIKDEVYTVKEISLLSTVFLDANSAQVQAPNNQLNTLFIQNIRRSPQMSETFTFDVDYATSFEDIEKLREKMLDFVKTERREFQPVFDVTVKDFPGQTKMVLSADIKYKSNTQHGALRAKRRNKWICALKSILAELSVFGPDGDPNGPPLVKRYTKVPWDTIEQEDLESKAKEAEERQRLLGDEDRRKAGEEWKLGYKNAALMDSADEVFGETTELRMTNPRRGPSQPSTGVSQPHHGTTAPVVPPLLAPEVFEMKPHEG